MDNELYHYGVKGMKWGVRRDARILANHRYNVTSNRLKTDYVLGRINTEQYVTSMDYAKKNKKRLMTDANERFKNATNNDERKAIKNDISKMTTSEVPHATLKRGAAVANQILGAVSVANIAGAAAGTALYNPAFAGAYLSAGAVAVAAEAGWRYLIRSGLDEYS